MDIQIQRQASLGSFCLEILLCEHGATGVDIHIGKTFQEHLGRDIRFLGW